MSFVGMVLTREEKDKLIEELYNQGKTYQQIAREARVSVRDIKPVLEKAEKEKEKEVGITNQEKEEKNGSIPQQQKPFSQAYRLFAQGKSPLDVAAELNIREVEATKYYREYWKLKGLYRLDQIYEDIKDDIFHIIRLQSRMEAARIGIEEVINLIKIANTDLPSVEHKYQRLKRDVNSLESRKFHEYRTLHQVQDQIADLKSSLKMLRTIGQEEEAKINQLQVQKIRIKRLIKLFEDSDQEYLKIKKTVEDKVSSLLLDSKVLLRLAFYSLIESMRKDPDKYGALINYASNNSFYGNQYYTGYLGKSNVGYPYQLNSNDSFFKALESTILEDANELYEQLLKEQVNTIIADYASRNLSPSPTTPTNNQL
jgi:DNA-binding CsgD family transcriptional regulator